MSDILEYVRQQLDREEWWAVEASRGLFDGQFTPTGEHWQWQDNLTSEPIEFDPAVDEYLPCGEDGYPYLGTVEKYPSNYGDQKLSRSVFFVEEMPTTVAGYLVNHDPATTLADIELKRAILDADPAMAPILAQRWRDRPDFKDEWRV